MPYRYQLTSRGMVKKLVRRKLARTPKPKAGTITPQQFVKGLLPRGSLGPFRRDEKSYFMTFPSSSSPGTTYQTRIWTTNEGRFHTGDVTCNCKGFIFNKHCHHQTDAVVEWRRNPNVPHIDLNI